MRTVAAGKEGNDVPIEVVTERWRSKELDLVLLSTTDDPRRGRTTYEITEINVGEPDASLFAAPAGYTVKEVQPNP